MGYLWSSFVGFLEQILILFAAATGSIGLGIILFTICTRIIILPLTLKSIQSSRKMQEVQPLIKELQRKYGKDQKKLQEETLKLYRDYKINPVGGCLPMFLQLPIFFGVYQAVIHLMLPDQHQHLSQAVRVAVEESSIRLLLEQPIWGFPWRALSIDDPGIIAHLLQQPFLGINLGLAPFTNGEFHGLPYLVLPILSVVFQLGQQLMATPRVQDPQQQMMTRMMLFMPLVFGYIAFTFPSGAVLYWATSSIVGVVQQYFVSGWGSLANYLKFLPPDRARPIGPEAATTSTATAFAPAEGALVQPRPTFWDVLRPLTEAEPATAAVAAPEAGLISAGHRPHPSETESAEEDSATEQAIEEIDEHGQPRMKISRRQRRRR